MISFKAFIILVRVRFINCGNKILKLQNRILSKILSL